MENEGYQPTDKLDTSNPPNESKMIKVNSKVFIKNFNKPPLVIMIVEGLYEKGIEDKTDRIYPLSIQDKTAYQDKANIYQICAKCLWYNTRNELQSAFINLKILTEL